LVTKKTTLQIEKLLLVLHTKLITRAIYSVDFSCTVDFADYAFSLQTTKSKTNNNEINNNTFRVGQDTALL